MWEKFVAEAAAPNGEEAEGESAREAGCVDDACGGDRARCIACCLWSWSCSLCSCWCCAICTESCCAIRWSSASSMGVASARGENNRGSALRPALNDAARLARLVCEGDRQSCGE